MMNTTTIHNPTLPYGLSSSLNQPRGLAPATNNTSSLAPLSHDTYSPQSNIHIPSFQTTNWISQHQRMLSNIGAVTGGLTMAAVSIIKNARTGWFMLNTALGAGLGSLVARATMGLSNR